MVNVPQVTIPDFAGSIARGQQVEQSRLQGLLARQAMDESQRFNSALPGLAGALATGEGPQYDSALAQLLATGQRGAQIALPLVHESRQRREAAAFDWGGGGVAPAAASAAGGSVTPAPAPAGDPSLPRGIRNNNPLNLTYVAGQPGVQGSDGRFGRFGTPEEGIAAATRQLQMYGQRGLTTPAQIIGRWAPPSENNTGAYVAAVARNAGLDPNQPVDLANPEVVSRLVGAMAQHENGRPLDPSVVQRGVRMAFSGGGDTVPTSGPTTPGQAAPAGGASAQEMAVLERALASPNPLIRQRAQARMQMLQMQRRDPTDTFAEETRQIGGRQVQGQVNRRTGQFTAYPGQTGAEQQSGPFGGTGMEQQANNVVLSLADKVRGGTATPAEQALYQRAYSHLAEGTVQFVADPTDPTGARQVAVRAPRNMGDLPAPGGGQSAPAGGATVPMQAGSTAGLISPAQSAPGNDAAAVTAAPPNAIPGMERTATPPAGFQRRADGHGVEPIPGGPQDQTRTPLTEAQGRSNMFGNAMRQAEEVLQRVQVPSGGAIAAWRNAPEIALNPMLSADNQQYFNAIRLFAAGILRKETGAAFTSQELLDVQSRFFPMPGDSAQVLAQKARSRQQAIASMQAEIPGGFRGSVQSPGPGGNGTAEPPPPPPAGFRVVR